MAWREYQAILMEAVEQRRAESTRRPIACPNDGVPLTLAPDGGLFCPSDGWRDDGVSQLDYLEKA